jgi:hypothetical protein
MAKRLFFIVLSTSLFFVGCASYDTRPFSSLGQKVDCGNGMRMMSYELCRLDSSGY